MKKLKLIMTFLVCLTLLFTGCKGSTKESNTDREADGNEEDYESEEDITEEDSGQKQEAGSETEDGNAPDTEETSEPSDEGYEAADSSDLETITDFSEYWSEVYAGNEAVINAYEGMPVMEIFLVGACFITGVQYDILNLENKDGRFEGDLMLAGYQGYVEKDGSKLSFGYEDVLEEDGFSPSMKAGDKYVENGSCNLADGYYYAEDYVERDGVRIDRSINEIRIEKDGDISSFMLEGSSVNYRNEEGLSNTFTFVRNGKDQYDFVVAKAEIGTDFEALSLEEDMTKEKAIELFEAAGFIIETSGGIEGGVFVLQ